MLYILTLCCITTVLGIHYEPTWKSIDSRPLPQWYDDAKFGIFIVWGVFSVPSFGNEWFWYNWKTIKSPSIVKFMEKNYRPDFTYADFAPQFTAEFFNPSDWADLFQAAGAKYIVLTSKHCEGFTNWPSKASWNWNAMDVGPKKDLVGELAHAIRNRTHIRLGLYHVLGEFYNPLFTQDKDNDFKTQYFVERKVMPELFELVNIYKPDLIWSDIQSMVPTSQYWNSTHFLAWLYNDSPIKDKVVVNDRWGGDALCKHGGYFTCHDRYDPGVVQPFKWENCMTIDKGSWGYRRDASYQDYQSFHELISSMAETISCGGNLLLNVGPTHDGRIVPIFEERLRQLGQWLKVNGEAIYASKPWTHQNDTIATKVWYTSKKGISGLAVYAIVLEWPAKDMLILGAPQTTVQTTVSMLGYAASFSWKPRSGGGMDITVPPIPINQIPSTTAWVFKITHLNN